MSLVDKTTSAMKWSSLSQVGRQAIQLATTVILTRLLVPSDFGLVGMAMVVIGFITLFHDLGTSASVIQKRTLSEGLLSSIFWINAAFGALAMIAVFLLAPVVARLYQETKVILILKFLSISFFISGVSIVHQAMLERAMAFHRLAFIEVVASASSSCVGIFLALLGAGVWSLVCQTLCFVTTTTVLLWIYSDWRPKALLQWEEIRSVSGYSLNLTGFNVFNYFSRNADSFLIGRYLGAQDLGYYTIAYRIMFYPIQTISAVLGRVMFPVYAQIQEEDEKFRRIYGRVVGAIALITVPMMMGLWALAGPFILTVLGPTWRPVIVLLLILAPVGMIQSIVTTVGSIYQAKGRTDWMFKIGIFTGILAVCAFSVGLQWGIVGLASAYAIATGICVYPNLAFPFKLIGLRVWDLVAMLWRPFVCSLMMLSIVLSLKHFCLFQFKPLWTLMSLTIIGIGVYWAASWMLNRQTLNEVFRLAAGRRPE